MRDTRLWAWHMIAGCAILILGGLHMVINHMDGLLGLFNPHGDVSIQWENVVYRSQMIMFTIVYILLLIAALFHGFYGLRNILLETGWGQKNRKGIVLTLWMVGSILFIIGTYAAVVALNLKA